ncbi:MAG TPA: acyloxyacyl hydrolase [Opitutaceae bacterium]|nr:acyloxyacyl hydrolase [Opitutaceae bacterium]
MTIPWRRSWTGLLFLAAPFLLSAHEPARAGFGAGLLGVLDSDKTLNFSADYRLAAPGAFQPRLLATWATDGSRLLGAGLLYNLDLDDRLRLTFGFGPGYYERNRGRDLGSSVEFISTAEFSVDVGHRRRLGLAVGHISNGGLNGRNPGTETLMLTWSVPVGR